ncbi:MAG TPA: hypothetical protein VGQ51_17685 [Puia sp.]|jgi:hypothetical protein|nr:hypothetical protein [Puia sp.]
MKPRSELFNWSRWCLLVSKHWDENRKRYLLALLAIAGLLIVWFSFILVMDKYTPMNVIYQYMTYFVGLYITGSLYASTLFAELSSKRDGVGFLALPASQLEKLLCALLFGILLFFVVYTIIFYAVDIPLVRIANRIIASSPRNYPNTTIRILAMPVYNVFTGAYGPGFEKEMHLFLFAFFSVQSAFLLGSVYFTRYSFIRMVVVLAVGLLGIMTVQARVILPLLPSGWYNGWTGWFSRDAAGNTDKLVALPESAENAVILLVQCAPPVLLWIVTWYRLKEKQV